ncbi:hypothetical protein PG990_014393 [Apiospora arundinis]
MCTGETIQVENLMSLMPAWFKKIHPQEILDEVNVRKQREKGEYVIISSVFYADCSMEKLITLTNYNYWIFMFDDEIDPDGDLTADDTGTRRICDQTLQRIDACLHPAPCSAASFTTTPPPNSPGTIEMLHGILATMRADMGPATVQRLRRQLHEYVEGVARQQAVRQYDRLPDPWYHLKLRCDDIVFRPSVTQVEYTMGLELPDQVVYHEAMERVVLGCAKLCVLMNEILSLEKEFRAGQLENLCLLFVNAENITIHAAIAKVKALIRRHYRSCEDAIARLSWSDDEQSCQRIATGTAQWSYMCTRYFQRAQLSDKWHMTATLRQNWYQYLCIFRRILIKNTSNMNYLTMMLNARPGILSSIAAVIFVFAVPSLANKVGEINMVDACHEQYGSGWAVAHNGNGANDW